MIWLLLAGCSAPAAAQRPDSWPSRPITIVVGNPPGGQGDLVGRYLASRLGSRLGQPLVVENRPGANAILAMEHVARQPGDGYTLFYGAVASMAVNPALQPRLPIDVLRDFRPVAHLGAAPQCLFVHASLPVNNAREFVTYARARPGQLTFASFGVGSTSHLQGELLKQVANIDMVHVPFRGSPQGMQELAMRRVDAFIIDFVPATPFLARQEVKCLAITGPQRFPGATEVPTFQEQGFPLELVGWNGLFAPATTPATIVDALAAEIVAVVRSEDGKANLARLGLMPTGLGPSELGSIHRHDLQAWTEIVRRAGVSVE
ncbi:Bug family tripartite tricarboxylate transporter substrate binding protein [Falsiroseomonas sp. HW251]|uniref:Bug family tripartite tricarboxylate transporter substrate binding protein n=1 Tax=Falsiroseomonas sp. HW251 TaxID=3390998 RepID=UPI003D31958D